MKSILRRNQLLLLADKGYFAQLILFAIASSLLAAALLDGGTPRNWRAANGLFWLIEFFVLVRVLDTIYRLDFASAVWQRIRLGGHIQAWLFGTIMVHTLVAVFVGIFTAVATLQFVGQDIPSGWYWLPLLTAPAAIGFLALGLVLTPLAIATGRRSLFQPLMMFPLGFPLFLSAGQAGLALMTEGAAERWVLWTCILAAVYTALASMLVESVFTGE